MEYEIWNIPLKSTSRWLGQLKMYAFSFLCVYAIAGVEVVSYSYFYLSFVLLKSKKQSNKQTKIKLASLLESAP